MSRASTIQPQRNLSLTEELEKLEQSITLTLQEIDHNFSRAHRIVTTSILPIVESYATHSAAVWDGSKFWKQFFESSANVSLSGYEELASSHPPSEVSYTEEETSSMSQQTAQTISPSTTSHISPSANDSRTPYSPTTPRAKTSTPTFTNRPSPYEALKAAHLGSSPPPSRPPLLPHPRADDSPSSSPFPASTAASTTGAVKGPLLHRVLDKTYRVASTPHKTASRIPQHTDASSSPASSSPAPPQLHSEIFSSPVRPAARTPGVSVLTPRPKRSSRKPLARASNAFATPKARRQDETNEPSYLSSEGDNAGSDNDNDDDEENESLYPPGLSPPKTIQFHIPRTQIMQTPAREASRRIVEDLMEGAGFGGDGAGAGGGGAGGMESSELDFEIDVGLPDEDEVFGGKGGEKGKGKGHGYGHGNGNGVGLLEEDSSF